MSAYTIGSLFSGYGGLDMGVKEAFDPGRIVIGLMASQYREIELGVAP